MYYLHSGVLKSAPGKQHILVSFLQDMLQQNLPGHTQMHPDSLYHAMTFCGLWHDLSSPSFSMSCLISPLLPKFSHSFSQWYLCLKSCPMRLYFLATSPSSPLPYTSKPAMPRIVRQLWIIKWWIRAYFLPTQTGNDWARSLAVGLIPLSTRNTSKSQRCPSFFSRKTVDSPAHPCVSSTPGSTRPGCCRGKFLQ